MALDASSSDTESTKKSSQVVGPLSRNDLELAVSSSSSSLSAYEREETRETDYVWVDNKVRGVFSKYREAYMLQSFAESVDIVLEGLLDGVLALRRCREYETVFLGRGENPKIFSIFILV